MKKLLFWTKQGTKNKDKNSLNYHRFMQFNQFLKEIDFEIAAVSENFLCTDFPVFNKQNIESFDFSYIVAFPESIKMAREFASQNNIDESKIFDLSYDFNQIQCELGIDCPQKLFYEEACIKDNKLYSQIKHINILEKYVKDTVSDCRNQSEELIVKSAVDTYILAKELSKNTAAEYQTGTNWANFLKDTRKEFYTAVENKDYNSLKGMFSNFYRNCLSTGILGGEKAFESFKNCKGYSKWLTKNFKVWKSRLRENKPDISQLGLPLIGNPYGLNIEGNIINANSFLFNYRANFCKKLFAQEQKTTILEIGGGFGGLGYYLHKIGTNCTYIDLDIPENLVVTEYFLKMAYPDKKIMAFDTDKPDLIDLSKTNLLEYDIVLLPNFMLPYFKDNSIDMIINTISLGEMGYDTICEYISQIDRIGAKFFYHENIENVPEYNGFPVSTYPDMINFHKIITTTSNWHSFDTQSKLYLYSENLLMRQ